jgi:hypothetical protein
MHIVRRFVFNKGMTPQWKALIKLCVKELNSQDASGKWTAQKVLLTIQHVSRCDSCPVGALCDHETEA